MAGESKKAEVAIEEEDRISSLPDSLIQHILSLLPSTKDAIQTGVLSKRWRNQWTRVPALVFSNSGMSDERFSRFIDNTLLLLNCSKIQKFHILSENYQVGNDPTINSKLQFAVRKGVEELVLEFQESQAEFRLPDYTFKHASLLKLQIYNCRIMDYGSVSWDRLKELSIDYTYLSDAALENILIGSPSLESLQLTDCVRFSLLKIASKSLKKVVLQFYEDQVSAIEISCPNLEELKISGSFESPSAIEFKDLSSLMYATLDFDATKCFKILGEILQQIQHVKELTFGGKFIEALAELENRGFIVYPLLKNRTLTLDNPDFAMYPSGIARALRMLPELEKLVIKDLVYEAANVSTIYRSEWKRKSLESAVPCLKTVHIVGLRKSSECEVPVDFINFLMKNSPVMEKLVVLKDP